MAFHKNNFAGQTVGVAATTANSANSGSAFTQVSPGSGAIVYASDPASGGRTAIALTPAGGTSCYVRDASFNSTQIALSDCFYYAGAPSGDLKIQQVFTAAGYAATVLIRSNGMMRIVQYGGTVVATATVALVAGHWYRIETQILSDASAGTMACQWYVDDGATQTGSLSGSSLNTRGGAITTVDRGPNASGDSGFYTTWYFTNLQARDGTTTPIGSYAASNLPPIASAGANQVNLEPYATVTHAGSGTDSDGAVTSYVWTQTGGSPTVAISNANTATMSYTAPGTIAGTTLTFQLTVTDNQGATGTAIAQDTILPATERAALGGVEVPVNTRSISSSASQSGLVWTAESGNLVRRGTDNFVLGVTKPDATNTGYAPGTTFTTVSADLTITTDNTTYTNTMFMGGKVYVRAKNVTFRNCWFRGQQIANAITDPFVRCHWNTAQGTLFDHCTFGSPGQVGWSDAGILGWNFTANRCDISRCSDGIRNVNSDTASNIGQITVTGCYIHDLMYISPSADGPDNQSHNDAIQLVGGSQILIRGNTLRGYVDPLLGQAATPGMPLLNSTDGTGYPVTGSPYAWMTGLIITPDNAAISDVTADQNWVEGGRFSVNIATKAYGLTGTGVTVTNNRFGQDTRIGGFDFIVGNAAQPNVHASGNTFPGGGSVPISNGG